MKSKFSPTSRAHLSALAESFPALRGRPGASPFNLRKLLDAFHLEHYRNIAGILAARKPPTSPEDIAQLSAVVSMQHALAFLIRITLGVDYPTLPKDSPLRGTFDVVGALSQWGPEDRAAFLAWTVDRWTPCQQHLAEAIENARRAKPSIH